VVCFSIGSRTSFENVRDKWCPELRKHAPQTPILLVGTQADRRTNATSQSNLISESEAMKLAQNIKASGYIECSAKSRDGVKAVFSEAVLVALDPDRAKKIMKKKCVIC
jgi:GTPase SAR1 family protein